MHAMTIKLSCTTSVDHAAARNMLSDRPARQHSRHGSRRRIKSLICMDTSKLFLLAMPGICNYNAMQATHETAHPSQPKLHSIPTIISMHCSRCLRVSILHAMHGVITFWEKNGANNGGGGGMGANWHLFSATGDSKPWKWRESCLRG